MKFLRSQTFPVQLMYFITLKKRSKWPPPPWHKAQHSFLRFQCTGLKLPAQLQGSPGSWSMVQEVSGPVFLLR